MRVLYFRFCDEAKALKLWRRAGERGVMGEAS
jgi:hypothetical protein